MPKVNIKSSASDVRRDSSKYCQNFAAKYVPATKWLPKYTKFQALSDLVAGITLGLTMIPQSIAYAAIAGLTPQYGLYSAFLGGFIYIILGSIKEVSIGPTSLMALLTLEFAREMPRDFMILLGFLAGCVELAMGLLNLGFLVDFISIPVTTGFTSATAVILIVHQLPHLLGLEYEAVAVIDSLIKLFKHISNIRLTDTALGLISVILLLSMRKLKDIKCKSLEDSKNSTKGKLMNRILWFLSTGRNVIIVLASTIMTYRLSLMGQEPFLLSGNVTSGLPSFTMPNFSSQVGNQTYTFFEMCSHLDSGIIIVPLVAVLTNVAIAKAFATGDLVDASQEMRTLGICNVLGSFVSSMPTCGSFTRSALSSASGVQTPMAGLYSGAMTLLALSFLTPYFHYIPQATLAAVLISAIVFMIDWQIVPLLWKGNQVDAISCLLTFGACVLVNVKIGLFLGTICNIVYLIFQSARPKISVTECKTNLGDKYLLLKPQDGLQFLEVNYLTKKISEIGEKENNKELPCIIDCQNFKGVDYTAIKGIERLRKEFEARNHPLWFLNFSPAVMKTIQILGDIKSLQILETDENIIECFQELQKTNSQNQLSIKGASEIPNSIKFSEIRERSDLKGENYDTSKRESTLPPEERLSLMADHKVEILTNGSSLTDASSQGEQNGTELSHL